MEKLYKIRLQDGSKAQMTYNDVCKLLGYIPEAHFVEITTAGTITFTAGKPCEVLRLAQAVTAEGLVQSGSLRRTVQSEFGR